MTNDSSYAEAQPRKQGRIGITVGVSFSVIAIALLLLSATAGAPSAIATTYTFIGTGPVTWTGASTWSPAGFPGSASGDVAQINGSAQLQVTTSIPNGVTMTAPGNGIQLTITNTGSLSLEPSSTMASGNNVVIDGGILIVKSGGTMVTNASYTINHNTFDGVLNLLGDLSLSNNNSTFTFNGGAITGTGKLTIPANPPSFWTGSNGVMTLSGVTIDNFGSAGYTSTTNPLFISNGAHFKIESGALLNLTTGTSINTDNVASPSIDVLSGGQLLKNGGTAQAINLPVANGGLVQVTTNTLTLAGGGTHIGAFNAGTGAILDFTGSHTFSTGATASASLGTLRAVSGSNFIVNSAVGTPFLIPNFQQTGGLVGGSGLLKVTTQFDWTAGSQSGPGTTEIGATATGNITSTSPISLDSSRQLQNNGILNYAASSGALSINTSSKIVNLTGSTFNFTSTLSLNSDGSGSMDNQGNASFKQGAPSTTAVVFPQVNFQSTSSIRPTNNGTIELKGGGGWAGTPVVIDFSQTNPTLKLSAGTFSWNPASGGMAVSGTGKIHLTGTAILNFLSGPLTVSNFVQDAGTTLKATSQGLAVNGTFDWTGGIIDGNGTSANVVNINPSTGIMNLTGATGLMKIDNTGKVTNGGGVINYSSLSNSLGLNNGAQLINNSNSFNYTSPLGITSNGSGSPQVNIVGGTLSRAGSGTPQIDAAVNVGGGGVLAANGGNIRLSGGGSLAGGFTTNGPGERIEIGGPYAINGGTISGPGVVAVMSTGSLMLNTNVATSNFELNNGGLVTLGGSGGMSISGALKWTGGTFSGNGTIGLSGTGDLTSLVGPPTLANGVTFNNTGTITYVPSQSFSFINSGSGATFNTTAGTFDIQGNGATSFTGAGHTFINGSGGIVKKTAGGGIFTINVPYNHNVGGALDNQDAGGTIEITGGGTFLGGNMKASGAGAKINFNSATPYTVNGGNFLGTGAIQLTGGNLTIAGPSMTAPAVFNQTAGNLTGTTLNIPAGSVFTMTGGQLIPSNTSILASGQLVLDSTASPLTIGSVTNAGSLIWQAGTNPINNNGASTIVNNNTVDLRSAGNFGSIGGGNFSNNATGTLKKTVNAGNIVFQMPLTNDGTVDVQAGTLGFTNPAASNHTGSFSVAGSATLAFAAGTHNFNAAASLTGLGTLKINGGTLNHNNGGVSVDTIDLAIGGLSGTGTVTANLFNFNGGTLSGAGPVNATNVNILGASGPMVIDAKNLTSSNTILNSVNSFTMQNGAVYTIPSGNFDIKQGNVSCLCAVTPPSFSNSGTIQKSTFSGISSFAVPITGSGALNVSQGTFQGTAAENFSGVTINGSTAAFSGSPITIGSIAGTGMFDVVGGNTTVSGLVAFGGGGGAAVNGGTLTLNGGSNSLDYLDVNGGNLNGSGNIVVATSFDFSGGNIGGSGSLTSNGTSNIDGATAAMSLSRPLINGGTMNYIPISPSNVLTVNVNTAITNNNIFNFTSQDLPAAPGVPVPTFTNNAAGTFQRLTGGTGVLTFGPAFTNTGGNVQLALGTTSFGNGYTQSSGTTAMQGGNIGAATMAINGGTLDAFGTVTGNLNMSGTLNVKNGASPAALAVSGNYTQAAGGTFNVKLNGTAPGTTYDQLNVGGNIALAGTLNATLGYTPVNGDSYKVLTYATNSGGTDFSTKTFPPIPGGGSFSSSYVPGPPPALQIVANTLTADLSLTQSAPSSVLQGQSVSVTLTLANAGPSAAGNVTVTDTFTNATFVSATAPAGVVCTGTGPVTCTVSTLNASSSANITLVLSASSPGAITNGATASSSTTLDPNTANNTAASVTITVTPSADMAVTKIGPNSAVPNSAATYSISVKNFGPSTATGVTLTDPTPAGLTLVSVTGGGCVAFPCNLGTMAPNATASISVVYTIGAAPPPSVTNTASVTATEADPNSGNNSSSMTTTIASGCPTTPGNPLPGDGVTGVPANGTLTWGNSNAAQYKIYFGPAGSGCNTLYATTSGNSVNYSGLQPATTYEWRIEGSSPSCAVVTSSCFTFTTAPSCAIPPAPTAPAPGAVLGSPITFTWSATPGATNYHLFASTNGGPSLDLGNTPTTTLTVAMLDGNVTWYVVATVPGCGSLQSPSSNFTVCNDLAAPIPGVVANASGGQAYDVSWDAVPGATKYEIDEALDAAFTSPATKSVTVTAVSYQHTVVSPTSFFYRVRAFGGCKQQFSVYSAAARIVLVPVTPASPGQSPNVNAPAGSKLKAVQTIFIPGIPGGTFPFSATVDKPWLTVSPGSGSLPPSGTTLEVLADPTDLPNGTFTGTVTVIISGTPGAKTANGSVSVGVPVSISLVTPIKPGGNTAPPANALVIPSVGHLDGLNSKWQSDVRLTNTALTLQKYALTFTPDDPAKGVKTTNITVAGGDTTALDDIVRNWYGVGTLGESANGVLLIKPFETGKTLTPNVSVNTAVASSRTYNVTSNGTLGQYIPAIPFSSFIGKAAAALSLQQIAQNSSFRTNLGLVEASGSPVSVLLSVFSNDGVKLLDQSLDLKANEQRQLNSFLAANNITLNDGRIEVRVSNGEGKVTAYASVVDNFTGDPLLVSGSVSGASNHFVLPGVAALNTGFSNWRSDVRIYNAGGASQAATLTFYPLNNPAAAQAKAVILNPGEVKSLDDIVKSFFGGDNVGGALHVTTSTDSNLTVTGRTYNLTDNGTYGQFIPAVTPLDGVGKGERSLNVLQVEDSVRYRTNLGLAELSGKPVQVEVSVFFPDSKVSAKVIYDLQPNEYRQSAIIHDLGLSNVYNARISVRVVDGDGRISAYGSVIDMLTQDPTYVPAQ